MKHICKYKMHKDNNHNLITPYFISDGGYFPNKGEMIGVTEDDEEVYVPKTVEKLTNEEFITYAKNLVTSLNAQGDNVELSDADKEAILNQWLKDRLL